MILALLLTVAATIPHAEPLREQVPVAERNCVYDLDGRLCFTQWLFTDEHGNILAWRMEKEMSRRWHPSSLAWIEDGRLRVIEAGSWVDSFEQYDKEIEQRSVLPPDRRKGLSKP